MMGKYRINERQTCGQVMPTVTGRGNMMCSLESWRNMLIHLYGVTEI